MADMELDLIPDNQVAVLDGGLELAVLRQAPADPTPPMGDLLDAYDFGPDGLIPQDARRALVAQGLLGSQVVPRERVEPAGEPLKMRGKPETPVTHTTRCGYPVQHGDLYPGGPRVIITTPAGPLHLESHLYTTIDDAAFERFMNAWLAGDYAQTRLALGQPDPRDGLKHLAAANEAELAGRQPEFLVQTDDVLSRADAAQLRDDIQITARPERPAE